MSYYTVMLKNYIESWSQDQPELKLEQRIQIGMPHLFDFDYPIFDESYRNVLNRNILNYYYMREVGLETIALFKFYLASRMQLIMPYYNKYYESELIKIQPLFNMSVNENYSRSSKGNADNVTTTKGTDHSTDDLTRGESATNNDIMSDTPQGVLGGGDYATTLNDGKSSHNLTDNRNATSNSTLDSNSSQSATNLEDYVRAKTGNEGVSQSKLLDEFRSTFINVDLMIIKELGDLFMTVY